MLNPTETARLAQLEAIPVPQRTPAQVKEIAALEAKQNS
jgi:hypothetical protein